MVYRARHYYDGIGFCCYDIVQVGLTGDFERGPFRHGEEQVWVARKV